MTARSAFISFMWFTRLFFSSRAREEMREAIRSLRAANIGLSVQLSRMAKERTGGAHAGPTLRIVKSTREQPFIDGAFDKVGPRDSKMARNSIPTR